ncbi:MAG: cytochrome c [Cyclobacteriaceae bacterium]
MKISSKNIVWIAFYLLCSGFISTTTYFKSRQSGSDWIAPKEAANLKNPLSINENVIKEGKKMFTKMCAICHGAKGKGDGVAGAALNPKPTNLTTAKVQDQKDGELFWKITEGRSPMASYKTILTEDQRWQLVSYMRTFK